MQQEVPTPPNKFSETRGRSRSVPRLGNFISKLTLRKSMNVTTSAVAPPSPEEEEDHTFQLNFIPTRKSSLQPLPASPPVEFQILPIAPASFAGRRPSTSSSDGEGRPRGASMSRRSISVRASFSSSKNEDDIGGIYGWDEEEAAMHNREYVEFMKKKGIKVGAVGNAV
ncbi:hypothetical protein HDU98_007643 [Podochytrium sp. JEL0797]|nr:hypothetical protein HDU98_007643 [Podochytrium sp. JEL0797]